MYLDQAGFDIRCEWGLAGVQHFAPLSAAMIIVDVLSFSTCVDVATANGAIIYPFGQRGEAAMAYAKINDALLAGHSEFQLSPSSLLNIPSDTRLVLPSPNGSTLSLATGDTPTFTGCLRNAEAIAHYVQNLGTPITVIPAGERWRSDLSLRPSLEDWLGAGAIIHALAGSKSPEAHAAEQLFLHFHENLLPTFENISSGRELIEKGRKVDVALAAELNVSVAVPRLIEGAYRPAQK